MNWRKAIGALSYDYLNSDGEIVANVQMVGIKGHWGWKIVSLKKNKTGWRGTRFTKEEAQKVVTDHFHPEDES